jgi:hypothetical protein
MSNSENETISDQTIVYSPEKLREKIHRRLEGSETELASRLIEKSRNSFDLSVASTEREPFTTIKVLAFPQDPFVSQPEIMQLTASDIQVGLSNNQFRIQDPLAANAKPNDEGNYIYGVGTPEFDQVNSFFYATRTLRMFEKYILHLIPWGFEGKRLIINPHAGIDANAFYSEQVQSVAFFSFDVNGKRVHSSQSPDVVCHEVGHAILDGIRDLYNESFGLASNGFHESFGDIAAILVALQNRTLINRLLEITKGNLRQDNLISALAEQLGTGLHVTDEDPRNDKIFYLRNAFNDFVHIPYDHLEFITENDLTLLGSEGHSYSRLFTGTFYDILIGLYESLSNELGQHGALSQACDLAGRILVRGIEMGPIGEHSYSDLALVMLDADRVYFQSKNKDVLINEFSERKILSTQDAQKHLETRQDLPSVVLPDNISSPSDALAFISANKNSLGLAENIELFPMTGYSNTKGFTFLNYFQTQTITLDGQQFGTFNGSPLEVFGGVSLMFDNEKKLSNVTVRLVSDEDIRQVKNQIAHMIKFGIIEAEASSTSLPLLHKIIRSRTINRDGKDILLIRPVQGISARGIDGELRLVKHPIHVDIINPNAPGIKEFVDTWKTKFEQNKSMKNNIS